jgi:hypothetical protein
LYDIILTFPSFFSLLLLCSFDFVGIFVDEHTLDPVVEVAKVEDSNRKKIRILISLNFRPSAIYIMSLLSPWSSHLFSDLFLLKKITLKCDIKANSVEGLAGFKPGPCFKMAP